MSVIFYICFKHIRLFIDIQFTWPSVMVVVRVRLFIPPHHRLPICPSVRHSQLMSEDLVS